MKLYRLKLKNLLLLIGLIIFSSFSAMAENIVNEHSKAQLVSKLVRYVSWPSESRRLKFTIGVYDDAAFYSTLKAYFSNKKIKSKTITVVNVSAFEQSPKVNMLYIPYKHSVQLKTLAENVRNNHVLLVSENSNDIENMMVNFLYSNEKNSSENNGISFEINDANIKAEALNMSSWLTYVAEKEISVKVNTLAMSDQALAKNQATSNTDKVTTEQVLLEDQLTDLNQKVLDQQKKLTALLKQNKTHTDKVEKTKETSQALTSQLKEQQQQFRAQSYQIQSSEEQLTLLTEKIKRQQKQFQLDKKKKHLQSNMLKQKDIETLKQQALEIIILNEKLTEQKKSLGHQTKKQEETVKNVPEQTTTGSLFYLALIIAVVALAVAGLLWLRYRKATVSLKQISTTLEQRDQQLVKSEQVASLGYVASDITYAVGTTLDDIYDQSMQDKAPIKAEQLKGVVTLLENFNQIAADQDEEEKTNFDLVSYINKIMMLFSVEFKHSDITYDYSGEKALEISSIPSQITLLIVNLVNNALKHGFVDGKAGSILINIEKTKKEKTKIVFQDNGLGMNSRTLAQAFEPYFTTKADRNYVGIGLSTSYDIVTNKLSGNIKITSQPDKGTKVSITL
jgi:signal transduction histidine kinase